LPDQRLAAITSVGCELPKGAERCVVEFHGQYQAAPGVSDTEATERLRAFYGVAFDNLQALFGKG
jgi:hypothetical protein